jgi:hypothetical protein
MSTRRSSAGVDRTAFRVVEWADHTGAHDARLRVYWLEQSFDARLAAAMRCRWRVTAALPPLDRGHLRLIDFIDLQP